METRGNCGDERLLLAERVRIQIWIHAAKDFRKEGKKIELNRKAVLSCGHQVGFERAQRAFVRLAIFVAELIPAGPPAGAQHVQASGLDLRHVPVPDVRVRMIEIETLD